MAVRVCHLLDKEANLDMPYFWSVAREHDAERFPVTFCTFGPPGKACEGLARLGTPQFTLNVAGKRHYPVGVWKLARLLEREKIDLVHAHFFYPTLVGVLGARLAGKKVVFTRHHSDHNIRIGKRWHTRVDAWCARKSDQVIAVSRATADIMIEHEGVPAEKITVVHNGMNPLREPSPERVAQLRRELGIQDQKVILMIARLHEEKGHRFLFDALPRIMAAVGPVITLLAGEGPHRSQLEEDVARRGLTSSVRFLGRSQEVPELLALSSVLTLPSLAESFGFVLTEAMSTGKPIVASRCGGIPEIVVHEETGLLVPMRDAAALADALIRVLADTGLARRLGAAGKQRFSLFSFERMMRGYESVYETLFPQAQNAEPCLKSR